MTQYIEKKEEPIKRVTNEGQCRCATCGSKEFNVVLRYDEYGQYNMILCAKCGRDFPVEYRKEV